MELETGGLGLHSSGGRGAQRAHDGLAGAAKGAEHPNGGHRGRGLPETGRGDPFGIIPVVGVVIHGWGGPRFG